MLKDTATMHTIEPVSYLTLLGVRFQADLKWQRHFQEIERGATRNMFVIVEVKRSGASDQLMWWYGRCCVTVAPFSLLLKHFCSSAFYA